MIEQARKGHLAGPARAASKVGRIELPIKIDNCEQPVIVFIPLSRVARLRRQLDKADVSARKIRELRRRQAS